MELKHIAFIMDGNGRWAKKRLLPRKVGHREGVKALERVIDACEKRGIKEVSFYAFSTENWSRPQEEIDALFDMVRKFADNELKSYVERNMTVRFMGDVTKLPKDTLDALNRITSAVRKNGEGMVVNIGLNYGGRDEIVTAVKALVDSGEEITKENIESRLYTKGMSDPDVIVRSSGEKRLSNFMLWQSAYSELIFIDDLWPDFNAATVDSIIDEYAKRTRRFGGLK
ncbi:MAG: di-trans,poly-cis-decaprenylcistransferase [Clostridia bacterium]|jgi:undecaprenyl diphosphate synthase|nr:di-trans,poly-cis-decaprenylcistransferase [Clostridia bacterium]MCX4367623.1 polyprenyl diphosphate synthase [Clostridia bacterium]